MHSHVKGADGEVCSICNMALVPTTREIQWVCPRHSDIGGTAPGTCPIDGQPLEKRSMAMPHGDHNPRHGGILFMAPNGFNHLEGTLSEDGVFRFYLYDDFTRPIGPDRVKARIEDRFLTPVEGGMHSEVSIGEPTSFPVEVVLFVQFDGAEEEERFDFIFAASGSPASMDVSPFVIPTEPERITEEIFLRDTRIQELMRVGEWTDLYIPAMEAKELALALSAREGEGVALLVKKIVRAAWLLDMYGDMGNRLKVESAYELFEEGIRDLAGIHAR
jgi:hypothetical protein